MLWHKKCLPGRTLNLPANTHQHKTVYFAYFLEKEDARMRNSIGRNSLWMVVTCLSAAMLFGCGSAEPPGKTVQKDKSAGQTQQQTRQQLTSSEVAADKTDKTGQPQPTQSAEQPSGTKPDRPATAPDPKPEPKTGPQPAPEEAQRPAESASQQPGGGASPASKEPMPLQQPEPSAQQPEPTPQPPEPAPEDSPQEQSPAEDKPEDLVPLVDRPEDLQRLDPVKPLWFDKARKRVVMVGRVVQNNVPLEVFACIKNTKEHEAILSVDVKAAAVHAGLLAAGANPGHPARWDPKYTPPSGTEIEITVVWKDADGKLHSARAQDWVYDTQKKAPMQYPWVFAGSGFFVDPDTGQRYYLAEGGDFICLSNFPGAMLDIPIESTDADASLMFQAYKERIPPRGTPVTVILTPKIERKPDAPKDAAPEEAPKPQQPPKSADESQKEAKQSQKEAKESPSGNP